MSTPRLSSSTLKYRPISMRKIVRTLTATPKFKANTACVHFAVMIYNESISMAVKTPCMIWMQKTKNLPAFVSCLPAWTMTAKMVSRRLCRKIIKGTLTLVGIRLILSRRKTWLRKTKMKKIKYSYLSRVPEAMAEDHGMFVDKPRMKKNTLFCLR